MLNQLSIRVRLAILAAMASLPSGRILLMLMVVGLVGYSLWGLIRAFFDPLHLTVQDA